MLEITIDNCHTCNLETINNLNSQYFWINRRDLEIEIKCNWQAIFDKCKDTKLTPNITFLLNKKFVRSDLFQKIIKSCKATNLESLKLKKKLGLCLYKVICYEPELISTSEKIFKERCFTKHDVENKQLKEENEKLRKGNEQLRKNIVVKDAEIKESIENPTEIKSPKEDKNTTDFYPNWFDKIKFKKILAIIDSSIFDYKNK